MMAAIIDRRQMKAESRELLRNAQVSPQAMVLLYMGINLGLDLICVLGGGTALFFIGRDEEGRRWAASSMHFAPPESVTWRVHFHIVSRGEVTVELPGEP